MDGTRFDGIARLLAAGVDRRRLAAGLAALAGVGAPAAALAGCKKVGKTCEKSKDCCAGARCKNGKCKCKNSYKECQGKCYDLDKDEKHCGSCRTKCGAGETCRNGTCLGEGNCPAGADSCSGGPAVSCGGSPTCGCVQSVEGETRCGDFETSGSGICGTCTSSADCEEALGPGAFCSTTDPGPGCCATGEGNRCLLPCPA